MAEATATVPEFASSESDQGATSEPARHGGASGLTTMSSAGMVPATSAPKRLEENPDGSPFNDEEARLADELQRVPQDIVARRQERKRKLAQ